MEEVEKVQGSPQQPLKGRVLSEQCTSSEASGKSGNHTPVCTLPGCWLCPVTASGRGKGSLSTDSNLVL